jgi:hypothetical protein
MELGEPELIVAAGILTSKFHILTPNSTQLAT